MGMEEDKEVTPTPSSEDVIRALLDYFVEPVLPPKRFHKSPSLDQQLSVAKQVRAVVILYNYYQRKLQPQLEFLGLVSFCKLAVVLKPALLPFLKLMHQSDFSQLVDMENELSPTEKAVLGACDLCRILGVSKCISGIEAWPIAKVAVLVIDSSMENCLLLRSTATQGFWSVIEKDLGVFSISSEGTVDAKYINGKRGTFKQTQTHNQSMDASALQQLALLAVMEVAGIDQTNIKVLESHVIYSLTEEAGAACFYVMQCTQSTGEGFQVPIKEVVDRLQGPLLKMTSNGWMVSPVAEYFHLLPYAGILSDLISRALLINRSDVNRATYSPIRVDAFNHGEINGSPLHVSQNHKDGNQSLENLVEVNQHMPNASSSEGSKCVSTVVTKSRSLNFSSSERAGKGSENETAENKKVISNGLHNFSVELGNVNVKSSQGPEKPCNVEVQENRGSISRNFTDGNSYCKERGGADGSNRKEKEFDDKEKLDKGCDITNSDAKSLSHADSGALEMTSAEELQISPDFSVKRLKKDIDGFGILCPASGVKNKNFSIPIEVDCNQKRKISVESVAGSSIAVTRCNTETINAIKSAGDKHIDATVAGICIQGPISSSLNGIPAADCEHVPCEINSRDVEKLQNLLATKGTAISMTALRVLSQKIEKMCCQQRVLEDKIALCSRDIQKIIDDHEDALALKLQAVIDFCKDTCLKSKTETQQETHQQGEFQRTIQYSRRNRLPSAVPTFQSPCHELDYICHVNSWRLPRYSVSTSTGEFIADVTMKETDFEFSCKGALLSTPSAARDSAAALMIAKLREMAGQT